MKPRKAWAPWHKRRPSRARKATIATLTANMTKQLGRAPTDAEVAGMLAMSVAKLRRLRD